MSSSSQNIGCHITLGEIATYINGYAFKPSDYSSKEGNPIIRIQDLTGNSYETNKFSGSLPEKYRVNNGDILISWSASLGVYEWTKGPAWLNQHIFKVVFDKKPINKSFFIHQARHIIDNSENLAHGATMRHLTKKVFDALPFYYPDPQEQQQIAAHLDDLSATIDLCKTANRKLENLVKSRFIEMFRNEADAKTKPLRDVCSIITDGTHQPPKFITEGVPFLFVSNIAQNGITYETKKFILEDDYKRLIKRTPIEIGDILVSAVGSFGHPAIVKEERPFCFQRHIAYLKPIHELIDSNYLHAALLSDNIQRYMDRCAKGVAQRTVTLQSFKEMRVPVPPLALQQEFAAFVAQVDKLRFATQQQIDKLETLKKSLMQEYFE